MRVLIIGSGGREHAIAKAFKKSAKVKEIFFTGKNAGMARIAKSVDINNLDNAKLIAFAKLEKIDLTFVGPEAPLLNGIVDDFQREGLLIFGPSKKASNIEGSKEFAKNIMQKYNIPTAAYDMFNDYEKAKEYVLEKGCPIVIKYDGLAAG